MSQNKQGSVPLAVQKAFQEADKYFPTEIQKFQFFDKYSRFDYEKGRRETWIETVDRAVNYLKKLSKNKLDNAVYEKIRKFMLEMKATSSMRLLAMAGPAAERDSMTIFNCSYIPIDSIESFVEILLVASCGTGVGFSVEKVNTEQLPIVTAQKNNALVKHVIGDSSEGWAEAFKIGMENWFNGNDCEFDYSLIRKAGAPLKIKGGRASGPKPLKSLLEFTKKIILNRQGQKLRPIDCHDIACKIGEVIVAGSVRRSALISLFDIDDEEMTNCKNGENIVGNEQRWMSNNSAVWIKNPDQKQLLKQMYSMIDGERGEPGIVSRENMHKRLLDIRRKFNYKDYGTNPSLRKGTLVYTTEGIFPIEKLENKQFTVNNLNGKKSTAKCFLSGKNKPLYEICLSNNQSYFATKEHMWPIVNIKTNEINKFSTGMLQKDMYLPILTQTKLDFGIEGNYEDGFLAGWLLGDGWITINKKGRKQIGFILSENDLFLKDRIEKKLVEIGSDSKFQKRQRNDSVWYEINTTSKPLVEWCNKFGIKNKREGIPDSIWTTASEHFRKGFIDGLFSSDGCVDKRKQYKNCITITLTSAHYKLISEVQSLLGFYGITGKLYSKLSESKFPNKKNYYKKYQRYDLKIMSQNHVMQFSKTFSLSHTKKNENLLKVKSNNIKTYLKVKDVKKTEIKEDVWDITVYDDTHCFQLAHSITGNCSEVIIRKYGVCNLSIAIARSKDTLDDLKEKVEIATIIGTIQSLATDFKNVRPVWKHNADEERLLGVDITGQLDCELLHPDNPDLSKVYEELKNHAIETNKQYARLLNINQSASVTCIKPSGNSSILFDCAAGIHARHAPYYVRNVRVSVNTPLYKMLKDQGIPMNPENGQTEDNMTTAVIPFPVKSPDNAIVKDEMSALDQCNYWLKNEVYWATHNVSVTISYKPNEVIDIVHWVSENKDLIGGMSFLPASEAKYAQMPYETITKEKYDELNSKFPKIDFSQLWLYEKEDFTTSSQEIACVSGTCSLDEYKALQSAKDAGLIPS